MTRPNILWLLTDQHSPTVSGFAGDPVVRTICHFDFPFLEFFNEQKQKLFLIFDFFFEINLKN